MVLLHMLFEGVMLLNHDLLSRLMGLTLSHGVHEMVFVLVWAIVGGTSKFYGPILGVVVLTLVNEVALRAIGLDTVRPLIYGIILLGFILFLPNGLESLVPKIISRWKLKK